VEGVVPRETENTIDRLSNTGLGLDHEVFENVQASVEVDANLVGVFVTNKRS